MRSETFNLPILIFYASGGQGGFFINILQNALKKTNFSRLVSDMAHEQTLLGCGRRSLFEKPHCVGEHLQCQDGIRRFKRCFASADIHKYPTVSALDPPKNFL